MARRRGSPGQRQPGSAASSGSRAAPGDSARQGQRGRARGALGARGAGGGGSQCHGRAIGWQGETALKINKKC